MEKKAVVQNVQSNGTFESKFGTLYKFEIEMDNGDIGEYSSKSKEQTKFVQGTLVDYQWDITYPKFPKIKPVNTFQQGKLVMKQGKTDDVQAMIVRQSSVKASIELNRDRDIRSILETADIIYDYCTTGNLPDVSKDSQPF